MEKVYRVESRDGKGPFGMARGDILYDEYREEGTHSCHAPPGPRTDAGGFGTEDGTEFRERWSPDYHSGFGSIEQLARWFSCREGRAAMQDGGFTVSVYEAPRDKIIKGNWQVGFIRFAARKIGELCLETLSAQEELSA